MWWIVIILSIVVAVSIVRLATQKIYQLQYDYKDISVKQLVYEMQRCKNRGKRVSIKHTIKTINRIKGQDNIVYDVIRDNILMYWSLLLCIKRVTRGRHSNLYHNGIPRLLHMSRYAVVHRIDIVDVVRICKVTLSLQERQSMYAIYAIAILEQVVKIVESYDKVAIDGVKGARDIHQQVLDISMLDRIGYVFGLSQCQDLDMLYYCHSTCMLYGVLLENSMQLYFDMLEQWRFELTQWTQQLIQIASYFGVRVAKNSVNMPPSSYFTVPDVSIMGNVNYKSVVDSHGRGFSTWNDLTVLANLGRYRGGIELYARIGGRFFSLYQSCNMSHNYTEFVLTYQEITVVTVASVLPQGVDSRHITVHNNTYSSVSIEIIVVFNVSDEWIVLPDNMQIRHITSDKTIQIVTSQPAQLSNNQLIVNIDVNPQEQCSVVVGLNFGKELHDRFCYSPVRVGHAYTTDVDTIAALIYLRPKRAEVRLIASLHIVDKERDIIPSLESGGRANSAVVYDGDQRGIMPPSPLNGLDSCTTWIVIDSGQDILQRLRLIKLALSLKLNVGSVVLCNSNLSSIYRAIDIVRLPPIFFATLKIVHTASLDRQTKEELYMYTERLLHRTAIITSHAYQLPARLFLDRQVDNSIKEVQYTLVQNCGLDAESRLIVSSATDTVYKFFNYIGSDNLFASIDRYGNTVVTVVHDEQQHCMYTDALMLQCGNDVWSSNMSVTDKRDSGASYYTVHDMGRTHLHCQHNGIDALSTSSIDNNSHTVEINITNNNCIEVDLYAMYVVDLSRLNCSIDIDCRENLFEVSIQRGVALVLSSSSTVDSWCTTMESICNMHGAIVTASDLYTQGGVSPCIALSVKMQIEPYGSVATKFFISYVKDVSAKALKKDAAKDSITVSSLDEPIEHFVRRYPCVSIWSYDPMFVFGVLWYDRNLARNILLHYRPSKQNDIIFVLALARYISATKDKQILFARHGKHNVFGTVKRIIRYSSVTNNNGMVLCQQTNAVSLSKSLYTVWAIRQLADSLDDRILVRDWIELSDDISDSIKKHCLLSEQDSFVQALGVLSGVVDKERKNIPVNFDHRQLDNVESILLSYALMEVGQLDKGYEILSKINPILDRSMFENILPWYGLYYDCIMHMMGIRISGDVLIFDPKLPQYLGTVTVQLCHNGISLCIQINSAVEWTMSIDGIQYNTNKVVITPSLNNKTITLSQK